MNAPACLVFFVALVAAWRLTPLHAAVSYEVLASFERPGVQVVAPLMKHSDGDFYGVASAGGGSGRGAVFKVSGTGVLDTLHSFSGLDGQGPAAGLVEGPEGALYGTTASGGSGGFGVVFKITTAGVFTKLVDFTGPSGSAPGSVPHGLMLNSDGYFYGVTQAGGAAAAGTVFRMTSAGVLTTLAELTGNSGARPGSEPLGPLVASNGLLYGVTRAGGAAGLGVVYEISTSSTWRTLAEFTGISGLRPGANPAGPLVLHADGVLYGTTEFGGVNDFGTFFKITTAPVHTVLRHFEDPTGSQPSGQLVAGADGLLRGTTSGGGSAGWGTVYQISTLGVHAVLANFTGQAGAVPGASPRGGMVLGADGFFHAATSAGAAGNYGLVCKVDPAGSFTVVTALSLPMGWMPSGAPVMNGDTGYFPMAAGGAGGGGNVMSFDTAGRVSVAAALGGTLGTWPDGGLRAAGGGVFHGLAARGGASSRGVTFRFTEASSSIELLAAHTASAGGLAEGPLVEGADGFFHGVAREGGASNRGAIFKVSASGVRTRVLSFTGIAGTAPGGKPRGPLVRSADGSFYGVTEEGGASNTGVLFRLTAAGNYSVVQSFGTSGPRSPQGGLVMAADGMIYGTTSLGGSADAGTLFRVDPQTAAWRVVGEFTGASGAVPGSLPGGELHASADGAIVGITQSGGDSGAGTLFRHSESGGLESLVSFTGPSGTAPGAGSAGDGAGLLMTGGVASSAEGDLYGVLPGGGDGGGGVLFRVTITTALSLWKQLHLGSRGASDTADPDFDGLPNLYEYALGTPPLSPDVSAGPPAGLRSYAEGDFLAMDVPRDPQRNDITLVVEASSTLVPGSWTALATSRLGAPFTGPGVPDVDPATPGVRQVLVRDTTPGSLAGRRFLRLRILH